MIRLLEVGLFYADELPTERPAEFAILQQYAGAHPQRVARGCDPTLRCMSLSEFLREKFHVMAYEGKAMVAGFNLPFDLSRLAWDVTSSTSDPDAFSFILHTWRNPKTDTIEESTMHPRLVIQHVTPRLAFMQFAKPGRVKTNRGRFCDLRTLAGALFDKSFSLARLAKALGTAHQKSKNPDHGRITPAALDYNLNDGLVTVEVLEQLRPLFDAHPIDLPPERAYSAASIYKAYLRAMGISPPSTRAPTITDRHIGASLQAFYGARVEAAVVKVSLPCVYVDATSMYPSTMINMQLWRLQVAERIDAVDATADVRALLADITREQCLDRKRWPSFAGFALIRRHRDDLLPVRGLFEPHKLAASIALAHCDSNDLVWYAIPDLIVSKLKTGRVPEIVEAWRPMPLGTLPTLKPVELVGELRVDPASDDLMRLLIEHRIRNKETRPDLANGFKCLANGGGYGVSIELNVKRQPKKRRRTVEVHDGLTSFTTKPSAIEKPGPLFFPPVGSLITAGARLTLALGELAVTSRGGSILACDTDSLIIAASRTGGLEPSGEFGTHALDNGRAAIYALSHAELEDVLKELDRLSPYDPALVPHFFKIERVSLDGDGALRQIECLPVSSKRYGMFESTPEGDTILHARDDGDGGDDDITILDGTEHGIGALLDPTRTPDEEDEDEAGDELRTWVKGIWKGVVHEARTGRPATPPAFADLVAVVRSAVSTYPLWRSFRHLNEGKRYRDMVKPFNFMLHAFPRLDPERRTDPTAGVTPIAPFDRYAENWEALPWVNKQTGEAITITTGPLQAREQIRVQTYGDRIAQFASRPEWKLARADGTPCTATTRGRLVPRVVLPEAIELHGKEGTRLDEVTTGLRSQHSAETRYRSVDLSWEAVYLPVLRTIPPKQLCEEFELSARELRRVFSGEVGRSEKRRATLKRIALRHARQTLGRQEPGGDVDTCRAFLAIAGRRCAVCGEHINLRRRATARFCSRKCQKADARRV